MIDEFLQDADERMGQTLGEPISTRWHHRRLLRRGHAAKPSGLRISRRCAHFIARALGAALGGGN